MAFEITQETNKLTIRIKGKFDAILAKELQSELSQNYSNKDFKEVIFDFKETSFLASSGLRVMIFAREKLGNEIKVSAMNANRLIMDVMKMSGIHNFIDILQ